MESHALGSRVGAYKVVCVTLPKPISPVAGHFLPGVAGATHSPRRGKSTTIGSDIGGRDLLCGAFCPIPAHDKSDLPASV